MKILVSVAALAFSTPVLAQDLPSDFALSDAQRAEGEAIVQQAGQALLDGLKDPASARYRQVFLRTTLGRDGLPHIGVCGQVNARNAMGGYAGWEIFAFSPPDLLLVGRSGVVPASTVCDPGRGHWDTRDYAPEISEKAKLD